MYSQAWCLEITKKLLRCHARGSKIFLELSELSPEKLAIFLQMYPKYWQMAKFCIHSFDNFVDDTDPSGSWGEFSAHACQFYADVVNFGQKKWASGLWTARMIENSLKKHSFETRVALTGQDGRQERFDF